MVHVRVAGALSGAVIVDDLASATLAHLRTEVARLLGLASGEGVKLILGGRTLQPDDGAKTLEQCGITASSRVLVVAGAVAGSQLQQQEAKVQRLEKVRRVLTKMSSRHSARHDNYSFEIVNQDGRPMQLQEEDRKALGMGMALHDMGKAAMAKGDYEEALQLLTMAEESFSVADATLLKLVDNVGMALLDVVWCCYKSGDIQRLAVARDRLQRARQALQQAYGPDLQRLRQLHGSRCPEHAIFTRLEALEAVAAYHCGDLDRCRTALAAAQGHWNALQVSDVALAQLQDMGYTLEEGRRALRMSGGDLEQATTHIAKDRTLKESMREKRDKDARWREERAQYGRLASGDYMDVTMVDRLESLGYSRELSALALRLRDNDLNGALEYLLGERSHAMLVQLLSIMQGLVQEAKAQQRSQQADGAAASSSSAASRPPRRAAAKLRPDRLLRAEAAAELSKAFGELMGAPTGASGVPAARGAAAASTSSSSSAARSLPSDEEVLIALHSTVLALAAPKPKRKARAAAAAAGAKSQPASGGSNGSAGEEGAPKRRATPGAESDDSWVVVGGGAGASAAAASDAALAMQMDADQAAEAAAAAEEGEDDDDEEDEEEREGEAEEDRASDAEMEGEVRASLQSDAMASYDLDVTEEGELIATYSAMVASAQQAHTH